MITEQRKKWFTHVHHRPLATETLYGHKCGNKIRYRLIYHSKSMGYDNKLVTPTGIEPVFQP